MIKPDKILRSERRTLSITIDKNGLLIVKAPKFLKEAEIERFIAEKESWIQNKMKKANQNAQMNEDLFAYRSFLLFGSKYAARYDNSVKSANFVQNQCVVPLGIPEDEVLHKVILTYKRLAKKWLLERTLEIAKVIGAKFDEFKISDTKGRWGCCTSNFTINLNWRVVCLKPHLIDYVIVHELCHLKEMNHSPKFWANVEKILPDYKLRRKAVKEMGFLFNLYRE